MSTEMAPAFDIERGIIGLGGRRIVLHCNHYNVFLQRTLEDGLQDRAPRLLVAAGMEAARNLLGGLEAQSPSASPRESLERAVRIFSEHGFGAFDISKMSDRGGTATIARSHYAIGWRSRWGLRTTPGCYFPTGYLAGAVAIASNLAPERVTATETACHAAGAEQCTFVVEVW
jgi:predicted hydrocarbon binding protein